SAPSPIVSLPSAPNAREELGSALRKALQRHPAPPPLPSESLLLTGRGPYHQVGSIISPLPISSAQTPALQFGPRLAPPPGGGCDENLNENTTDCCYA